MAEQRDFHPDLEWLDHVRPVGLVIASSLVKELGLTPQAQTQIDTAAAAELIADDTGEPALADPWRFVEQILGWPAKLVAGAPGGPELPAELSIPLVEHDTTLEPSWAVANPAAPGSWQLLVRVEPAGVDPDARGALDGWEASPHQRFERLLRETGVYAGVLVTDEEWRLVYAPKGETSGWLAFPLRALATVGGRPMLGGLKLILSKFPLFIDPEDRRLPALLRRSREAQAAVSTELSGQVLGALHELLRGLHAAEPELIGALAAERSAHLYEGLLTVLMRLVFILYAEDRDLIPSRTEPAARTLYDQGYAVRSLHGTLLEDAARHPDTMDERLGAWGRLLALFRLIHAGDGSGWIKGRAGKLFDPNAFPFLEGRKHGTDPARVPRVTDGVVLRVLDSLRMLKGERLSYRALDVEQIGSVYETVMGFTVEPAEGPVLAIKAGKNNRTPVFVDLAKLLAAKPADRLKLLKEEAHRGSLTPKQEAAVKAAATIADLARALDGIVDERGSPDRQVAPAGTPILQPTEERRRTGSHYTPRGLTEPIVRHALEPAFDRLGPDARPEQILDLKICDPAMGSGAFLVEACRAVATRLVAAWARWPETRPQIPDDEDEELHARRLVAQNCLYGVDRNPMATDLAKLSLWLATLARDHEFTFLDHALKTGDSLVGLTRAQIGAVHWDSSKDPTFVGHLVEEQLRYAVEKRAELRSQAESAAEERLRPLFQISEARLEMARVIGDGVIAAFFAADKAKLRLKNVVAFQKQALDQFGKTDWSTLTAAARIGLPTEPRPLVPFHWQVEFPEVFNRANPGFDAIVGNPPFAGKNTVAAGNPTGYGAWLQTLHEGAHGNADLVAHFFRRAYDLLRPSGVFGLIATNTIGQGDTRSTGLTAVLSSGGSICRATRRLKWPGEAAVVVSVVHVVKGDVASPVLDGGTVRRISAYLVEGDLDTSPALLAANAGKAFVGCYPLGVGFTFDDLAAAKGHAESLETMHALIEKDSRNAERIFPYIGGEEVNTHPRHAHHRYVIDFFDRPLHRDAKLKPWDEMDDEEISRCRSEGVVPADYPDEVAADWPDLIEIIRQRVKPERDLQKRDARRVRWWQFAEKQPGLRKAIAPLGKVLVRSLTSTQFQSFTFLDISRIYDQTLIVWASDSYGMEALLLSRTHEIWARFLGATFKDDGRYNLEDCFRTFPFPLRAEANLPLEIVGETYHAFRAALMIRRNEGLTKTYNRFHDRDETAADIAELRGLHAEIDQAVLRAYGWDDLAAIAEPEFIEQDVDEGKRAKTRLDWPSEFKDEVLSRLLALNAERAAEEDALGIVAPSDDEIGESLGEDSEAAS